MALLLFRKQDNCADTEGGEGKETSSTYMIACRPNPVPSSVLCNPHINELYLKYSLTSLQCENAYCWELASLLVLKRNFWFQVATSAPRNECHDCHCMCACTLKLFLSFSTFLAPFTLSSTSFWLPWSVDCHSRQRARHSTRIVANVAHPPRPPPFSLLFVSALSSYTSNGVF